MIKYCDVCNLEIDPRRVKALPNTTTCVTHSREEKKMAIMQTYGSGDNTYNEIEIVDYNTALKIAEIQNKKPVIFESLDLEYNTYEEEVEIGKEKSKVAPIDIEDLTIIGELGEIEDDLDESIPFNLLNNLYDEQNEIID